MATIKNSGRNTAMFYALIAQFPGYERKYQDVIKESIVNEFLELEHGKFHGRQLSISRLTDMEYHHLIKWLKGQVSEAKTKERLHEEAIRKKLINEILSTLSRINVHTSSGFEDVNYHILRIPYSKGRIIPRIPTDELPGLLGAVRGYCDGIKKQQLKEQAKAFRN